MDDSFKTSCKHQYVVGYSYRMPNVFFRSVPCDKCGCRIRLSMPWYFLFCFIELAGFIAAFSVAQSVHIKFLGTTLIVSLILFVLISWIVQLIARILLRNGKWVEVKK